MKILALETSDKLASLALLDGQRQIELELDCSLQHAQSVLPAIDRLLDEQNIELSSIDAFAVDVGPGSFTGVRIGITIANALALASSKPVVGIDSLSALMRPVLLPDKSCAAIIDARNGNGYAAGYKKDGSFIEPCACVIDEFLSSFGPVDILVGTGTNNKLLPRAIDIALIARERLESGYKATQAVTAMYLRPSQAERLFKEK